MRLLSSSNHRLPEPYWIFILLGLGLVGLTAGCRAVQTAANIPGQAVRAVSPGKTTHPPIDPVEVQQKLLRFSDEFTTRMVLGIERLRRGTNAADPAEILRWKIAIATETCSIASAPNALANLLDMTVFVTVTRMALEEHWQPRMFGESAQPMLESAKSAELEIWQFVETVLTPEQRKELRSAIQEWNRQNPQPESVLAARALGFASRVGEATRANAAKPDSVFSMLGLDPLAAMDPAVREIAQSRLFAERALYVTQKMPMLLRWQTELLSLNATDTPAIRQMISNATQIAISVERFANIGEKLPGQLSNEREAILKELHSQEKEVAALMASGTLMSTSLNATLTTFDGLMKRFGVGETNNTSKPADTNSPPFNILDYAQAAREVASMSQQLDALIKDAGSTIASPALDKRLADLQAVSEKARTDAKSVLNHAFLLAGGLVVITFICALMFRRFSRPGE